MDGLLTKSPGDRRMEPREVISPGGKACQLNASKVFGAGGWDRTSDLGLRTTPLFHLSYVGV